MADDVVMALVEVEDMRELVTSFSVEYVLLLLLLLLLLLVCLKETVEVTDTLSVDEDMIELLVELIEVVEALVSSLWLEDVMALLVGIDDDMEELVVKLEELVEELITSF